MKYLKYILNQFDGIWSIPLAFIAFWLVGLILTTFFGLAVGTYDMAFIQPLFLSIAVVVGATNAAVLGLWFNFRGLYKWFYGFKDKESGKIINYSKENWLKLTAWQKFVIFLFTFSFLISAVIIVYIQMI